MSADKQEVAVFKSTTPASGNVFGLTQNGGLFSFNLNTPGSATAPAPITGLQAGDALVGIDFRPATGLLYGLAKNGTTGRLYLINRDTTVASLIGTLAAAFGDDNPYAGLAGSEFGVDFNPVSGSDHLRVVSDTGENLTVSPTNATVTTGTNLNPGTPSVTAAAYTDSFQATVGTSLYVIDSGNNKLYQQNPTSGTLTEVGNLNIVVSDVNGFDINAVNGTAVLAATVGGQRNVYTVNLSTGAATLIGALPATVDIRGLAIRTPGTPEVFAVKETSPQVLVRFSPTSPASVTDIAAISGLNSGETVMSLAFRQSDGLLYALGSSGRVYNLNTFTGVATQTAAVTPALTGTRFGASFNPGTDLLRIVGSGNENLRANVDDGTVTPDPSLGRPPFTVNAAAYDTADPSDATLYVIDSAGDRLLTLTDDPGVLADGQLVTVGGLGVDATDVSGFDIVGSAETAYAVFTTGALSSSLYTINLLNGKATLVGAVNVPQQLRGIALQPAAAPAANADIWGVTATNVLVSFPRNNPSGTLTTNRVITGLNGNVVGVDFRAADAATTIWVLTDTSNLCSILLLTGAATCNALTDAGDPGPPPTAPAPYPLAGALFGFDYDPVQNIFRIVSDAEENLNVNPTTRVVTVEPPLVDLALFIGAAAYSNNFAGAVSTTLYVVDAVNTLSLGGNLKTVPNPDTDGFVSDVGPLNVRSDAQPVSLDILGGQNGLALMALRTNSNTFSTLYRVNLTTGAATSLGNIGPAPNPPPPAGPETRITVGSMAVRFPPQ